MRKLIQILGLLFLTSWASTAAAQKVGDSYKEALSRLTLEDLDGKSVTLSSYLGRGPILFDFWATWCKPCIAAMPGINQLHKELSGQGLQVIGINEDGPRNVAKVKPYMQSKGYDFTVLLDLNRKAQRNLNALGLPTTLLLDSKGTVVHSSFGYRPGETEKLRDKIKTLLESESGADE